ncbi:hypothetical protein L0F63_002931, partial [Massospora cicadina]
MEEATDWYKQSDYFNHKADHGASIGWYSPSHEQVHSSTYTGITHFYRRGGVPQAPGILGVCPGKSCPLPGRLRHSALPHPRDPSPTHLGMPQRVHPPFWAAMAPPALHPLG